jgi:chromosome segregation ATPase
MTPREIEKAIQFLLEQQAQTQGEIGDLAEQNKKLSVTVDKLRGTVDQLVDGFRALGDTCRNLVEHARLTNARITRLEESESP